MQLIILSGKAGSGKDSAADYLVQNKNYTRVAFADALKEYCSSKYGIHIEYFHNVNMKDKPLFHKQIVIRDAVTKKLCESLVKEFVDNTGARTDKFAYSEGKFFGEFPHEEGSSILRHLYHTPRSLLLYEGKLTRAENPNYWIDRLDIKIQDLMKQGKDKFVVSDARFLAEINQIKTRYPSATTLRINRTLNTHSTDATEVELDNHKFDQVILNDSTLEALYQQLDELVKVPNEPSTSLQKVQVTI